jgi:hypothetical protein
MMYNRKSANGLKALIGFCALAISAALQASPANAQAPIPPKYRDKPYFIEFRARSAYNYGHTFLVHGRVGQKITKDDVVGLHPFTESSVPWMIGHIIPVPSETGASDGDYEDEYIIARYRIYLSEAEYKPILATMRDWQGSTPLWHAAIYNCNAFVGSVARHMGLETQNPVVAHLQMPKDYVEGIRDLNGGKDTLTPGQLLPATPAGKHQQVAAAPGRTRTAAVAPKHEGNKRDSNKRERTPAAAPAPEAEATASEELRQEASALHARAIPSW